MDEHSKVVDIVERYTDLVRRQEADPKQWQAVHRLLSPSSARLILKAVCEFAPKETMANLLYQLTESPAMLFVRLGDGLSYDEALRCVVFGSAASANAFSKMYPDWFSWVVADGVAA